MVSGIIYRCKECNERFFFTKKYSSIKKAPCPNCDTCALEVHTRKRPGGEIIECDKRSEDLFDRVSRYNGR